MESTKVSTEYFASIEDPIRLADEMKIKINQWRDHLTSMNLLNFWSRLYANYYGQSLDGNSSHMVMAGGSEGELSLIKVNDLRTLLQQQLVTVTSQRPTGIARAINADSQSLKSAKIGTAISEYYMSEANFEAKFVKVCEMSLLFGEAFTELYWDKDDGEPIGIDQETMQPEMSGDAKMRIHAPFNVARDTGSNVEQQHWHIVSYKENKYDLAARYPKFKADIIAVTEDSSLSKVGLNKIPDGSDEIFCHLLIHDRTPALPNGRYSLLIGDKIVLDTELPFKDDPIDRIAPSDIIEGGTGYSAIFDLMAIEQGTDALYSTVLTNNVTFGGQSLVGPQGAEIKVSDLGKGMRYFELPPDMVDKLKSLQLTHSAPETYTLISNLTAKKSEMVGNVSATIGQQAVQGASGSAMALVQAQAIQFNSGIQRSYFRLLSSSMTKLIFVLAKYADTPRVARIVGKIKSQYLKEFKYTGQDLNSISSIIFEMTNAMSQSIGGKLAMGQDLLKAGMISNPKQYIQIVTTGNADAMEQPDDSAQLLLVEENEWLSEGKDVQAVITENHNDHIKYHTSVLSSPKAKEDPAIVETVLTHIQEHINLWEQASMQNPGLLMATGQQPLAPPPMPGVPPGQVPPSQGAPQGTDQLIGSGAPPAVTKADETAMPQMPINPATQERVEAPQGAL